MTRSRYVDWRSTLRFAKLTLAAVLLAVALSACADERPSPASPSAAPSTTAAPSPTAVPSPLPPAALTWTGCDGLECARIDVPLDYAHPADGSISLPLIRKPASDPAARIGSLLVNPGGPGASGVDFVRNAWSMLPEAVRARFDIVGWDPRGVAGSDPAVDCLDDLDAFVSADPSPDDVTEQEAQNAEARRFADGCEARSTALLPWLATEHTARDMDRIRASLGDEKLTYLGYSYGTYLGAVYASLFPTHIRAMVLDSANDPAISTAEDTRNQVIGFERALDAFLSDCAAEPSCAFHSDGDPGAALDALFASLEERPIAGDGTLDVGPGMAWLGVASALYSESLWPDLAQALALAREGDGSRLLELSTFITGRAGPTDYNDEMEQRIAIHCVDDERLSYDEKVALQQEIATLAPRFGAPGVGPAGDPCDFWPVPSSRVPAPVTAPGAPPVVVIGVTGDPATPYQQSVALAAQLESGVLITYEATRHTAYAGLSPCIDDPVNAYLIELTPPRTGLRCP